MNPSRTVEGRNVERIFLRGKAELQGSWEKVIGLINCRRSETFNWSIMKVFCLSTPVEQEFGDIMGDWTTGRLTQESLELSRGV